MVSSQGQGYLTLKLSSARTKMFLPARLQVMTKPGRFKNSQDTSFIFEKTAVSKSLCLRNCDLCQAFSNFNHRRERERKMGGGRGQRSSIYFPRIESVIEVLTTTI